MKVATMAPHFTIMLTALTCSCMTNCMQYPEPEMLIRQITRITKNNDLTCEHYHAKLGLDGELGYLSAIRWRRGKLKGVTNCSQNWPERVLIAPMRYDRRLYYLIKQFFDYIPDDDLQVLDGSLIKPVTKRLCRGFLAMLREQNKSMVKKGEPCVKSSCLSSAAP